MTGTVLPLRKEEVERAGKDWLLNALVTNARVEKDSILYSDAVENMKVLRAEIDSRMPR